MRDLSFVEDGNSLRGFLLNVGRGYSGNYKGRARATTAPALAAGVTCVTNEYLLSTRRTSTRDGPVHRRA